jgi:hypothetical protein
MLSDIYCCGSGHYIHFQLRCGPHLCLAASVVRFQVSLSPASLFQPLILISKEKLFLISYHLSRGLPIGLLSRNFPSSTFFGILELPFWTV